VSGCRGVGAVRRLYLVLAGMHAPGPLASRRRPWSWWRDASASLVRLRVALVSGVSSKLSNASERQLPLLRRSLVIWSLARSEAGTGPTPPLAARYRRRFNIGKRVCR